MPRKSKKHNADVESEYNIKELDFDMIPPNINNFKEEKQGGCKIFVIGKPGTGKSTLIKRIMYEKQDIIPFCQVFSGTEDSNSFFGSCSPDICVYDELKDEYVQDYIKRQKIAKKYLDNPWGMQIFDDCMEDISVFRKPLYSGIFKNGRHHKSLYIFSIQYCLDLKPSIRSLVDGVFILRETIPSTRQKLYENFGAGIPTFELFNELMDKLTDDFSAMYIRNSGTTSNNLEDIVFYYKIEPVSDNWEFGSPYFWEFHKERYDPNYEKDF